MEIFVQLADVSYSALSRSSEGGRDFANATLDLIGADAMVMPIDDVDMALGRAFDVLNVVRLLLGCPVLIPLVSGDLALYRPIIDDYFLSGGSIRSRQRLLTEQVAAELAQAYLTKLFPAESRVQLLPLADIISNGARGILSTPS